MLVVALIGGGALALNRMRIDIFPPINQPKIFVFTNYGGYDPGQIEGLLVSQFEFWFQFVDGVRNMESKSIQQVAVIELSFYPDTDMSKAMSQVVSVASRAQAGQPDGTLPPLSCRWTPAMCPSATWCSKARPARSARSATWPRTKSGPCCRPTSPAPSLPRRTARPSGHHRQRRSRQATHLQPHAPGRGQRPQRGNAISPSGNLYVQGAMPLTPTNAMVRDAEGVGHDPAETRPQRLPRATWRRSPTPPTSITVTPWWTAASPSTCRSSRRTPPRRFRWYPTSARRCRSSRRSVPEDVDISFEFDESPTVVTAVKNVATEGLIGAGLTGLMILLFLRDLRSVVVVVFNIPMALLGSLCGLWLTGNTINIMTLGGLALAIGILVDEATVEIENIHVQMELRRR